MRVLIIEDDPIHREGLTFMLGQDKDIDIAGSFMSAESAMEFLAASWSPGKVDIVLIDPKIARRVLTMLKGDSQEVKNILTEREKETLTLIGQGKAYKEIAGILNISIETVKVHIKNIYGKLQAGNKTDALRIARLKGYI